MPSSKYIQCCRWLLVLMVSQSISQLGAARNDVSSAGDGGKGGDSAGPWSALLEDWAVGHSDRQERILQAPHTSGYYISNRVDTSPPPVSTWSQEYNPPSSPPPPGNKILNRPAQYTNYPKQKPIINSNQNYMPSGLGNSGMSMAQKPTTASRKEVSETDLYLLGAIEKLVYRVDFMEKRLKKAEELIFYIMAGNGKKTEPCNKDFTRVGANCYHFGISKTLNWKSASDACKGLGATLAEMETIEENQDVVTFIQANAPLRGNDYWTGGLNPGLLWIWSNSARPVSSGGQTEHQIVSNATNSPNIANPANIKGEGRCLKLSYSPNLRTYSYLGFDCAQRQNYMCELIDKSLSNDIQRISKELKLEL